MARLEKAQGLAALRQADQDRRARTRLLIELGGLVVKAGLHAKVDDDRATLLGGLLVLHDLLAGADPVSSTPAEIKAIWRRRGLRAFDADAQAREAQRRPGREPGPGPQP